MRKIANIFIILLVLFFITGFILVKYNIIQSNDYNQTATIVGGIASLLGLLSLFTKKISTSDIKSIDVEVLKNLAKTAEEIQKKEAELNVKQNSITQLQLQQNELEFLVKKASLSLFYKEQLERYYERFQKQIDDNREISRTIKDIQELEYNIQELDIEIEKSPNTDYILSLIEKSRNEIRINYDSPFELIFKAFEKVFKL